MGYSFAKIHGAGNDFVFIEDMADAVSVTPEQVAAVCDRHFGIGADGLILVKPATDGESDGFMLYYNSDGTTAQMCGNGVRCFAKYMVDRGMIDVSRGYIDVQTPAGKKHIDFELDDAGKLTLAKVDMGRPVLAPAEIPTTLEANKDGAAVEVVLDTPFGALSLTTVSMGNPHCVVFEDSPGFFDDPASFDIDRVGPYLERHEIFPEKCNIEFAYVGEPASDGATQVKMRVWERGCGETLACGTGACATGVAAFLSGRSGRLADVHLLGGTLRIECAEDGRVLMTGPAVQSFEGTVEL